MRAAALLMAELTGMGLLVAGFGLIWLPLALLTAGIALLYIGWVHS